MMRFRTFSRPLETTGSSGTGKYCSTLKHFTCKHTRMSSRLCIFRLYKFSVKSHMSSVNKMNTVVRRVTSHVVRESQTMSAVLLLKLVAHL